MERRRLRVILFVIVAFVRLWEDVAFDFHESLVYLSCHWGGLLLSPLCFRGASFYIEVFCLAPCILGMPLFSSEIFCIASCILGVPFLSEVFCLAPCMLGVPLFSSEVFCLALCVLGVSLFSLDVFLANE
jgi:hypothetical protein